MARTVWQDLSPMKHKATGRVHLDEKSVAWICWNPRYWRSCHDVTKTLWRHSFFINADFNKFMLQVLLLSTLYPLALVSTEKDVSCLSLYGFDLPNMVMTTKTGGNLLKNKHGQKTKPRILRESKIRRLKVLCSNHFAVTGLPTDVFGLTTATGS